MFEAVCNQKLVSEVTDLPPGKEWDKGTISDALCGSPEGPAPEEQVKRTSSSSSDDEEDDEGTAENKMEIDQELTDRELFLTKWRPLLLFLFVTCQLFHVYLYFFDGYSSVTEGMQLCLCS